MLESRELGVSARFLGTSMTLYVTYDDTDGLPSESKVAAASAADDTHTLTDRMVLPQSLREIDRLASKSSNWKDSGR